MRFRALRDHIPRPRRSAPQSSARLLRLGGGSARRPGAGRPARRRTDLRSGTRSIARAGRHRAAARHAPLARPVRPRHARLVRPGRASVAGPRARLRGVARARHAVRPLGVADLSGGAGRRLFGRLRMVRRPAGPARPARRPPEHSRGPRHPSRDGSFPVSRDDHGDGARAGLAPRPRRTGPRPRAGPVGRTGLRRAGSTSCAACSTQRHHRRQRLTPPRTARAQRSARCPSSCRGAVTCLRPSPARPCGVRCSHSR